MMEDRATIDTHQEFFEVLFRLALDFVGQMGTNLP